MLIMKVLCFATLTLFITFVIACASEEEESLEQAQATVRKRLTTTLTDAFATPDARKVIEQQTEAIRQIARVDAEIASYIRLISVQPERSKLLTQHITQLRVTGKALEERSRQLDKKLIEITTAAFKSLMADDALSTTQLQVMADSGSRLALHIQSQLLKELKDISPSEDTKQLADVLTAMKTRTAMLKISIALNLQYRAHIGSLPTLDQGGLTSLINAPPPDHPHSVKWKGPYLKPADLIDQWGKPFHYTITTQKRDKPTFSLFSSGPDQMPHTADDLHHVSPAS